MRQSCSLAGFVTVLFVSIRPQGAAALTQPTALKEQLRVIQNITKHYAGIPRAPRVIAPTRDYLQKLLGLPPPPSWQNWSWRVAAAPNSSGQYGDDGDFGVRAMMGINQNSKNDAVVLESTGAANFFLTLMVVIGFCFLIRMYPHVYVRDDVTLPEGVEEDSWFVRLLNWTGWLHFVQRTTDEDVIERCGLDGFLLIEYQCMMRRAILILIFPTVFVLCPMHLLYGMNTEDIGMLSRIGINNLPPGSSMFWVHVFYVWFVSAVIGVTLIFWQMRFQELRFKWLLDLPMPECTTVMIENIPQQYRTDRTLKELFQKIFGKDAIERAYVVRHASALNELINHVQGLAHTMVVALTEPQQDVQQQLEKDQAHTKVNVEKESFGFKSQAIETERSKLKRAISSEDRRVFASSGFVTFKSRRAARMAANEQFSRDTGEFVVSMAPDPNDLLWKNLALDLEQREHLDRMGRLLVLLIFLAWMPCVVFLSSLTTLHSLAPYLPFLADLCEKYPVVQPALEGVLSTLALNVFIALLPTMLLFIIREFFCITSGAQAQYHMQWWFYGFQLMFVVLICAMTNSLLSTLQLISNSPKQILSLLAMELPSASHFYLNYLVVAWFTVSFEQVRLANLLKYTFFRSLGFSASEAKRRSEPEADTTYGMGSRMSKSTTYATIAIIYCTCSPIILILAWVLFRVGTMTYTWLLGFAETRKPDLGGPFWVLACRQTFLGLIIFNVLMISVLAERAHGTKPAIVASGSLFILIPALWTKFSHLAWEKLPFLEVFDHDVEASHRSFNFTKKALVRVGEYKQNEIEEKSAAEHDDTAALVKPLMGSAPGQTISRSDTM